MRTWRPNWYINICEIVLIRHSDYFWSYQFQNPIYWLPKSRLLYLLLTHLENRTKPVKITAEIQAQPFDIRFLITTNLFCLPSESPWSIITVPPSIYSSRTWGCHRRAASRSSPFKCNIVLLMNAFLRLCDPVRLFSSPSNKYEDAEFLKKKSWVDDG